MAPSSASVVTRRDRWRLVLSALVITALAIGPLWMMPSSELLWWTFLSVALLGGILTLWFGVEAVCQRSAYDP